MKLKTLTDDGEIILEEYDRREAADIFIERNSYVLEVLHQYGDDYGGSQQTDERETTVEEIIPERILVKDGHFCGVSIIVEYNYCNGGSLYKIEEVQLLVNDSPANYARDGFYYADDDHSRWNYTDYYLRKRKD